MSEDDETQAFSETLLMDFKMNEGTLLSVATDQIATTNAILRGNMAASVQYATDMYDLTLPLDTSLLTALRKAVKTRDVRADMLVNVNNKHNNTVKTIVSTFTANMFTTPQCDDEMPRLLLSPEGSGIFTIREAVSTGRIPDDFRLLRLPEFDERNHAAVFAMFFLATKNN